ncbi:MAG: PAS domain S-box protein [Deltaproteobacteria bacterium]|nr:PAS domain S-box protein [Deltaproteobacteria bacterium]
MKAINENFAIKVFAAFIVFVFVISFSFCAFFIHNQRSHILSELINNGSLLAGILAHNSRIGVYTENEELLNNPVGAIFQQEGVLGVSVFNLKGELLKKREKSGSVLTDASVKDGELRRNRILERIKRVRSPYYLERKSKLEFWSPVITGSDYTMEESLLFQEAPFQKKSNIIGLVMISIDKKILNNQASEILVKSILIGLIFLIAGSGITYFVSKRITKPLNRLTEGVKTLGVGGAVKKVPVETGDEIGKLAKAFNDMSSSLYEREKALRESEEKYRQFCESLPQVVFETDEFDNITFTNRMAFDFFGYSREDIRLGLNLFQVLIPEDRDRARANIQRILNGGKLGSNEYTALRKDRSTYPVLVYSSPIIFEGKPKGLRGILVDLTEFKRIQNALLESKLRYRDLVENVYDMIWEVNDKLIYTYVSPQSLDILGYNPEELLGKSPFDFMRFEERTRVKEIFLDLLAHPRSLSDLVFEKISKDGSLTCLESSGTPYFDADGKLRGFRGIERNVTERNRAQKALKESEKKYRLMNENIPVAVYSALPDEFSTNLFISGRIEELTGYSAKEFSEEPKLFANIIHPKDKKYLRETIEECSKSPKDFDVEYRIITKENNIKWIRNKANPVVENKRIVQFDGFMEDITEKKNAENELRESREQLRNLSRYLQSSMENERTRIAREIHDDLGQYLTALKMDLSWFKKRLPKDQAPLQEKEKSMQKTVNTAIESIERIISNLRPGPLDDLGLTAAIEWLIGYFQNQTGIKGRYRFDQEEYMLDGERSIAIYRILQESLTNIARHSNATEVDIELYEDDGSIVLKVTDNGTGILKSKALHPESFGLMGMRERAYLFQGDIKIEGIPDKGTTITASIPIETS